MKVKHRALESKATAGMRARVLTAGSHGSVPERASLHLQPKHVIDGDRQVLFRPQVALGGLDGGVAEQKLNLLEVPAGCAAELGAGPAVMPNAA